MIKVEYDKPIEVTKSQYQALMKFGGVAGRIDNGHYFIKVWHMKYAAQIQEYLNK